MLVLVKKIIFCMIWEEFFMWGIFCNVYAPNAQKDNDIYLSEISVNVSDYLSNIDDQLIEYEINKGSNIYE